MNGDARIGTVYLIHFSSPLAHARHYLGWTADLPTRMAAHASGSGARLMAAVERAGIEWRVVRTWEQVGLRFERRLKRRREARVLCPVCKAEREEHRNRLRRARRAAARRARVATT